MNKDRLKETLIRHEGIRLKPYKDSVGKITIGIGRNLDDIGISHEEAGLMFLNDLDRVEKELCTNFKWFPNLSDVRQEVLMNMCFNLGITKLKKFVKFLKAVELGNWSQAAIEMKDSLWTKQVGQRSEELAKAMLNNKFEET